MPHWFFLKFFFLGGSKLLLERSSGFPIRDSLLGPSQHQDCLIGTFASGLSYLDPHTRNLSDSSVGHLHYYPLHGPFHWRACREEATAGSSCSEEDSTRSLLFRKINSIQQEIPLRYLGTKRKSINSGAGASHKKCLRGGSQADASVGRLTQSISYWEAHIRNLSLGSSHKKSLLQRLTKGNSSWRPYPSVFSANSQPRNW